MNSEYKSPISRKLFIRFMKNKQLIFLLIIFWSIPKIVEAQEYLSLPDSNAVWVVSESSSSGDFHFEYSLSEVVEDTFIGSTLYTKIFLTDVSEYPYYAGAFRNDTNGRSYFVPPWNGYTEEHLWYDFSLQEGDTAFDVALNDYLPGWSGLFDFVADSIITIEAGPHNLKCIFLSPIPPYPPFYTHNSIVWVDGIGSLNGGIYNMYMCGLSATSLRCASINDTIYYFSNIIDCDMFYEDEFIYSAGECKVPVAIQDQNSTQSSKTKIYTGASGELLISDLPVDCKSVLVFNQQGLNIYTKASTFNPIDLQLSIHGLKTGIYIVVIDSENERISQKVLVN